jgi:creatinine amidohydrolase
VILDLATATWEEVAAADLARAVAILPLGATEAHGPHLPLGTDVIIAEAMARAGATRLSARGATVLLLPALALAPAPFAQAFPGTMGISPATMTAYIRSAGEILALHGTRRLALANGHLDPTHLGAVHKACAELVALDFRVAFPDLTRKPWALRLGEEFRSGACHAGRFETSIVLAARPELVRDSRRSLPANPSSLSDAIRAGIGNFHDAGGPRAYFGEPAQASVKEGRELIDALGAILEEAALPLLTDD